MKTVILRALVVWVALLVIAPTAFGKNDVPEARLARLCKGVNLSHWLAQSPRGYGAEHLDRFMTDADFKLIRSMGFTWVRLTIEPENLWNKDDPAKLEPAMLKRVDGAVRSILDAGLAVSVDMHPKSDFKKRLREDDAAVAEFAKFWQALAANLSSTDPERVFLEVLNEPEFEDAAQWQRAQGQLLRAMRAGAPRHTLIACGAKWSGVDQLLALTPYEDDANVVYTFHFYDPGTFTHQGANWGYAPWKYLRDIPWPGTTEAVERVLPKQLSDEGRKLAQWYAKEGWDAGRVRRMVGEAAGWAKRHDVRLVCGEFGVYRQFAPPADRAAWLKDVVGALEANQIGWCMWDYAGGFAVVNGQPGKRTPDDVTARALGLNPVHETNGR